MIKSIFVTGLILMGLILVETIDVGKIVGIIRESMTSPVSVFSIVFV